MNNQLRLPVTPVAASLILCNGSAYDVDVYVPTGLRIADIIHSPATFMSTTTGSRFLMFSRDGVAAVSVTRDHEPVHDLPTESRRVRVRMTSGIDLTGRVTYLPSATQGRMADHLNDADESFALFNDDRVLYVSKKHVAFVEELS